MSIDQEIRSLIGKHIENAVIELASLIQGRVADAVGIPTGRGNGIGIPGMRTRREVHTSKKGTAKASRVVRKAGGGRTCIAPNCRNTSKGPRFHFLCDKHMKAPKAQWTK